MIETERLLLRPFVMADVTAYAAIRAKPEVVRHLPGGEAMAIQAEAAAARVVGEFSASDAPSPLPWAVIEKSSARLIGHLGLRRLPELGGEIELLYMLDSAVWGLGYATEGAKAALDHGFTHVSLERIIALAVPENLASQRVMEKIGMRRDREMISAFGLTLVRYTIEKANA